MFIAPDSMHIPTQSPNLDDLGLERLSPDLPAIRTHLNASFPSEVAPNGVETWILLEDLNPGQRYEIRVCWLATQPSSFSLSTFTLPEVFDHPPLMSSLSEFSYNRLADLERQSDPSALIRRPLKSVPEPESILFLQVITAADYFTTEKSLMENPPPVDVDIILDPYLFNVFPRSLVPTAGYILIIALGAWFVSRIIWSGLANIAQSSSKASASSTEKKRS
ncbi:hypothetical protein FQN54_007710 [Arachnomyces sp. PD_36]|nr:hypothetical protein FQN54_007710 [Arachnomyces sp. PD_36]